jgi:hypothetical protein
VNKLNKIAYGHIVKALLLGPCSVVDLAEACGMHERTLYELMNTWEKMHVVFVKAWDPDSRGRDVFPVYALGEGRKARKRKLTPAQRSQRARDKKKLNNLTQLTTRGEQNEQDNPRSSPQLSGRGRPD